MSTKRAHESNQGHQAKMNSSDWSGLKSLNSEDEDGWTQVLSKSSKRKLLKKQKQIGRKEPKVDNSAPDAEFRSRSNARSRAPSGSGEPISPSQDVLLREQDLLVPEPGTVQETAAEARASRTKPGKRSRSTIEAPNSAIIPETPSPMEATELKM